jgi:hypothetical protein
MQLETLTIGIPCSFLALGSGALLAVTSRWGLFRHWWVTLKLLLLVGVIVLGATVTGASIDTLVGVTEHRPPAVSDARRHLVLGAGRQALMVLTAIALSVFRPGGRLRDPKPPNG